jgi:hypothetical protein
MQDTWRLGDENKKGLCHKVSQKEFATREVVQVGD